MKPPLAPISRWRDERGQMTVELMAMLPALLLVAVVSTNLCLFLADCAAFDRISRNAVRLVAAAPSHGQTPSQCAAQVQSLVEDELGKPHLRIFAAAVEETAGQMTYTVELEFSPTLFGLGLRSSVLGVPLPVLRHRASLVVDVYEPGVIV